MRIERTGPIERLTPRVERFLREALRGVALDDVHSPERTRIDFSCLSGLLAVEIKSLEGSPSQRMNNFVDTIRDRPDFPSFFGSVPAEAAFKNMEEPDRLRLKALERLGRPILTHLEKANEQLHQHNNDFPRQNRLNIVVLINEDHPEYDPQTTCWIISKELKRCTEMEYRYDNIDAVLFLTERHGIWKNGNLAFPITMIHGVSIDAHSWKEDLLNFVGRTFSSWQNRPIEAWQNENAEKFQTIEHIPESMSRHEHWRLSYRRHPYLRSLTNAGLRDAFDEVMALSALWGFTGSPVEISDEMNMTSIERFTHIQEEMHHRALPMEAFSHDLDRHIAAATRLRLPQHAIDWLRQILTRG